MNWTAISLYDGSINYSISGIYKIAQYDNRPAFYAYYIKDGDKNWGYFVAQPPSQFQDYKCWASLEDAKKACEQHSSNHAPKAATSKRAAEILASFSLEVAA